MQLTHSSRGYSLIELIVALGLFSFVMTIATGGYLIMLSVNRNAQAITTGVNSLSYALESMTRTIRTGSDYTCNGGVTDCNEGSTFKVKAITDIYVTYGSFVDAQGNGVITQNDIPLTDSSINVTSLTFYATGMTDADAIQANVIISITGRVPVGPGKPPKEVNVQSSATMRGTDI